MNTVSSLAPTTESGLIAFIKRKPVISMSVLTLLFAWPGLIWEALYSRGLVPTQSPIILSLLIG